MAGSTKWVQTVLLLLLGQTITLLTVVQGFELPEFELPVENICCAPGLQGPKGDTGQKGSKGEAGNPGAPGIRGDGGSKGEIGPMGPKGMTGQDGTKGHDGENGQRGSPGLPGARGLTGPKGTRGDPGDTVFSEKELDGVREMIDKAVNASIIERIASVEVKLPTLHSKRRAPCQFLPCENGTRIAYLDTTQGQTCPSALGTFTNTTTNQTACGPQHTTDYGASVSMIFPTNGRYTHVCGRVRGYVFGEAAAFWHHKERRQETIDSTYVDGVSITMGNPRQHLWTCAAGLSETHDTLEYSCPCARSNYDQSYIPTFIRNNYYCESGFVGRAEQRIAWEDPLWDGKNCVTSENSCCQRSGWFHREVPPTEDYIEVRWMKYWPYFTEVMTDQLEIWVM